MLNWLSSADAPSPSGSKSGGGSVLSGVIAPWISWSCFCWGKGEGVVKRSCDSDVYQLGKGAYLFARFLVH